MDRIASKRQSRRSPRKEVRRCGICGSSELLANSRAPRPVGDSVTEPGTAEAAQANLPAPPFKSTAAANVTELTFRGNAVNVGRRSSRLVDGLLFLEAPLELAVTSRAGQRRRKILNIRRRSRPGDVSRRAWPPPCDARADGACLCCWATYHPPDSSPGVR
jgi:hypothetical protein